MAPKLTFIAEVLRLDGLLRERCRRGSCGNRWASAEALWR